MAKPSLEVFIGADTSGFTKGLKTVEKQSAQFGKDIEKNTKQTEGFGSAMGGLGGIIAGAFAVGSVVSFGKAVIDITAEFQKFEAVLTNTLGSKSAAKVALNDIQDFAAKTPFSVSELTNAFVKLANSGFKPTTDEMRKLGDVASSTGKTFDMLAEAIIDAQTGEFERLKEFGIRARKEGDKVQFMFKGVATEADFTNESIRNYILSLGDLQGVSGSMAAISKTLGGQISNLGDTYDQMLLSFGEKSKGAFNTSITGLSTILKLITDINKEQGDMSDIKSDGIVGAGDLVMAEYKKIEAALTLKDRLDLGAMLNTEQIGKEIVIIKYWNQALANVLRSQEQVRQASTEAFDAQSVWDKEIQELSDEMDALKEVARLKQEVIDIESARVKSAIKFNPNDSNSPELDPIYIDSQKQTDPMAHLGELGAPTQEAELFGVNEQLALAREGYAAMNAEMLRTQEIGMMIGNELGSLFDSMFNDLAEGVFSWQNFGRQVLATLGKIITKLMTQAIVQAIAAEAPKGLLGVATGAAAAAGFGALINGIPKFADGGIVSGQTMGVMGEYSGAKSNPEVIAPLDKLQSLMKNMGGSNVVVSGETRISGRDLVVVLANENRFTSRTN